MTPTETVALTRYVKACCPQQAIDDYTPDAWYDLLGDLELADCRAAVKEVCKRQPFIAPAEIRAEVRRVRNDRLAREIVSAPPPELTDKPGRYQTAIQAGAKRIADGFSVRRAIARTPAEIPPAAIEARKALGPALARPERVLSPQEAARRQVAESRATRGVPVTTEPVEDEGEPAA
jgi:hypothetical protein